MLWFVLFILGGEYLWLSSESETILRAWYDGDFALLVLTGLVCVLIAIVTGLLAAFVASLVGLLFPTREDEIEKVTLVALKEDGGTQGSFFLGTGSIDGDEYYRFYKEVTGGGYQLDKIDTDEDVTIFEGGGPYTLTTYRSTFKYGVCKLIATRFSDWRYEFRIPVNSLARDFKIG